MIRFSSSRQPVFIVGLPRSGTTLLTAMLGAHSRLSCGPETYVFSDLTPGTERSLCASRHWPTRAVDYLFSIVHGKTSAPANYGIDRQAITDYLRGKDKTLASIALALPEMFMKEHGKERWIEKTPGHIMYTDKIRAHFPNASIIQIRRDPRDVALSLVNVPWGPETFLGALTYCYEHHRNDGFFDRDRNSYTVEYEALLASPESELRKICEFLHEAFEPSMLDTTQTAALIDKANDSWMKKAGEKVDQSRANAWRNVLTPEQKRQADAIIGCYTEEREALSKSLPFFVRMAGFTSTRSHTTDFHGLDALREMIENRDVRFWSVSGDERPIGTLFLGNPESRELLGYRSRWERTWNALAIAGKLVEYRIWEHPYSWPWFAEAEWSGLGYCAKLIAIALGRKRAGF